MSARCTSEPISWLRLERYHLGELADDERARIASHVVSCAACAACLERIERDEAVVLPALRDLRERVARDSRALPVVRPARRAVPTRWPVWIGTSMGALAAAAAVVLGLRDRARAPTSDEAVAASGYGLKGEAVAFSLVRDDGARIDGLEGVYRDGDRFKAIVTCPPGAGLAFDVVVVDASGASFPLEPAGKIACGNDVALPGAFRLTGGDDETVCLAWSAGALERREIVGREPLVPRLCKRLSSTK